ncbi:trigger factor [Marinithermus hydrothermalis]|uniref:Trigger factor n=1 Tax=Marinithermus hydrothermalis (strain DSM 14884 / JCM 11576 / T1) TaxID=869210 RepID=F2NMJ9_MARHT|nr:trigger factor [Marinithermus hydrothermalis]AEB12169.1 Trigger factor [Marinithermus hydrothermalis DSM 14884]
MAEILEREGYRVKIKVEVPAEEVARTYESVVKEYAKRVRVPGFRPGKAPRKVIEARIGREALLAEARERLVDRTYPEAVKELELLPVSARIVEDETSPVEEGQPFTYVAEVENYPEVTLPDWQSFALEAKRVEVTEEMVAEALERLRQRYAEIVTVEREAREGDHVVIETEDGARFPVDLTRAQPHVKEALMGAKAGDEVQVPIKDEEGNVTREVRTRILEVKEVRLPELDDEFAKTAEAENLEELKGKVRESLERQADREFAQAKKDEFLDKLAQALEVEIPPSMIAEEERHLLRHLEEDLAQRGVPLRDYLKDLEKEGKLEEFKQDLRQQAERRVRRGLALEKLVEDLGVELTDEEWKEHLAALARSYGMTPAEFQRAVGPTELERQRLGLLREKALEEAVKRLG